MKEKEIIQKWLNYDPLEKNELEAFKQLDAYSSFTKISEAAKKIELPSYDQESELENVLQQIQAKRNTRGLILKYIIPIAAVLVLCLGLFGILKSSSTSVVSSIAEQKITILPDDSQVKLNASSRITFSAEDWKEKREVELSGEAFFQVAKGKKFEVKTAYGTVSVLGTQFNVKQRDGYFEVICYEGRVLVTLNNHSKQLSAGDGLQVISDELRELKINRVQPGWIADKSYFESVPLLQVLQELERQYDFAVLTENIDTTPLFTGNFVHSDIQTALQSITIPMGLKYEINDKQIILTKE